MRIETTRKAKFTTEEVCILRNLADKGPQPGKIDCIGVICSNCDACYNNECFFGIIKSVLKRGGYYD